MNVINTVITAPARSALSRAAALLAGAARTESVRAEVALLCLAAVEQLRALDVDAFPGDVQTGGESRAIAAALAQLGALPAPIFGLPAVLDAASHARRAHQLAR
jgi:hypothetical protein